MPAPLQTWPLVSARVLEWEEHPLDVRRLVELTAGVGSRLEACELGVLVNSTRLVPWSQVVECVLAV